MPAASTGVTGWRLQHPTFDGRGVLIAILDSGIDPGIQGLQTTSTGESKVLDYRDVSGECTVPLTAGAGGSWTGWLRELPFGNVPQADFNGNGTNRDSFRLEVARDGDAWKVRIDANGDGSLDDEPWLHDFLVRRETFTFASAHVARGHGPITAALNLTDEGGRPALAVYLETGAHGSHVAGIAAGYGIYGISGFNGMAPGAQLIAIRMADNARGGISTNGSMSRGMEYAYRFAQERHLPLVMNMSFGVGNANERRAVMDSIINQFLLRHPDVVFTIAAGNDGPGTSTVGEPGSAELALSVGAAYPGSFAALQFNTPNDYLAWFSSRGGELAKPDIVAPGLAYSTVPAWNTGDEIKGGTSMAAPYAAGLAASLISAMLQEQRPYTAASIRAALRATARPLPGLSFIDQGPGMAQIEPAYQWLRGTHEAPRYTVDALPAAPGPPPPPGIMPLGGRGNVAPIGVVWPPEAAYRRNGLASAGDTVQRFRVSTIGQAVGRSDGQAVGRPGGQSIYRLVSDSPWLRAATPTATIDERTRNATIEVHYDRSALNKPGRYVGTVNGYSAADSAAGPAFVLANTIIVPWTGVISARGQRTAAGSAQRWYVRVPEGSAGLGAMLTTTDSAQLGTLYFYEPTGRPARGNKSEDVGGENGRTASITVDGEDVVPGVWEIVVQAMPGRDLVYDLDVHVSPVSRATVSGSAAAPVLTLGATRDTTMSLSVDLLGWAQTTDVAIERGAPLRRTFQVFSWVKRVVVEIEVAPETWDQLTDFAITIYDSTGAQLGNGAMNYPFHRVSADMPANHPGSYLATVELFPAFANPTPPDRVTGRLRVRFEGDLRPIMLPVPLPLTRSPATLTMPAQEALAGWQELVLLRAGAAADRAATTQVLALPITP